MERLGACHCCGLVHRVPTLDARSIATCTRCDTVIKHGAHPRARSRTAALALSALIIYPIALTLPVMEIERLGHERESSIWSGMVGLLAEGEWVVGIAVLLFSIVTPITKLVMLFLICAPIRIVARRDETFMYKLVEFIGRWSMVDVLLVAVLVAFVKLGDLVSVTPGPGVAAFGAVVVMSLIAGAVFDPHTIWEEDPR